MMAVDREAIKEGIRPMVVGFLRQWEGEILLDGKPATHSEVAAFVAAAFRKNVVEFAGEDPMPDEEELKRILPGIVDEICGEECPREES